MSQQPSEGLQVLFLGRMLVRPRESRGVVFMVTPQSMIWIMLHVRNRAELENYFLVQTGHFWVICYIRALKTFA